MFGLNNVWRCDIFDLFIDDKNLFSKSIEKSIFFFQFWLLFVWCKQSKYDNAYKNFPFHLSFNKWQHIFRILIVKLEGGASNLRHLLKDT